MPRHKWKSALRATGFAALAATSTSALASGWGEAPFIGGQPKVDGTDFYAFRSYEPGREAFVTFIANQRPLQDPFAGGLVGALDPEAIYEIHVDSDGDALEDVTFRFDFEATLTGNGLTLDVGAAGAAVPVAVPLSVLGPQSQRVEAFRNHVEAYSIDIVRGDRRTGTAEAITDVEAGDTAFEKPLDFVGTKTVANYAAYAAAHVFFVDIPGCDDGARVFVGQRAERSGTNLGAINDLVNLDVNELVGPPDQGIDPLAAQNVTSIALEVPISCIDDGDGVIGAWTTNSLRQARVLNPTATFTEPARQGGPWAQVSRVGMPWVNDLFIGLPDKDRYNASEPSNDGATFGLYFTHPTYPEILEILFGGVLTAPNNFPRADLVDVYRTGVVGLNRFGGAGEMVRLDLTKTPTVVALQSRLGALNCFTRTASGGVFSADQPGCDVAGFPNGRRPGDDVTDITLRLMMGLLAPTAASPSGGFPLTDGTSVEAADFDPAFPYLTTPTGGAP